ncbi:quinol:cytochrome c oxidoreductase iron-sulfur protein precursor [Aquimarina sp. MAR_2010_214]|uniref:TAT-variant-translocated molybdopterin oxidoreductase n=1 Tax=Aquimarina sp. MAR_2010_214 TaxID=1250026 RepID=UPI000C700E60|nr:TAT-variant-translocated molybdopterin oxidoreductase [Aquimarina sp. MAR_2010_214]PKV49436.1 quinol:cytochrome c oxidoreductase iron-sulfur protein precursor [Aquimarina sp. MAR_2010_214]
MSSNKKYWKSVEELNENSSIVETLQQNEFVKEIPTDEFLGDKSSLENSSTSRRDFLKYVGFSTAAASLAACEGPVKKSIPYVVQPDRIVPGVANYYATTIADGYDFASVLIKTREGRPIKVENNNLAASNGDTNARVHASVLSLYDSSRLQGPKNGAEDISWEVLDKEVGAKLNSLSGKQIVLLTQTYASPSTSKLISEFKAKYQNVKHVVYDAVSNTEALDAYQMMYGERALADYDFSKANTVVSIAADFLGDWQGGGYDSSYAKGRIPKNGKMSKHIQFEANMSLTGANADRRVQATPSEQKQVLAALYKYVTGSGSKGALDSKLDAEVVKAAKQIQKAGSNALVVTGIQDVDAQLIVLEINKAIHSKAFNENTPRTIRQGDAKAVAQLVKDMNAGRVGSLLIAGVNPMYSLPNANEFKSGLEKVDISVAFSMHNDATAELCDYIATTPHYLESWGDVELKKGSYSLTQPTIRPLFDARQFQETLLKWTGNSSTYHDYIKSTWTGILGGTSWNQALHDGVLVKPTLPKQELVDALETPEGDVADLEAVPVPTSAGPDISAAARRLSVTKSSGIELTLYTKTALGDGQQASNPWLQEMPDPITRASWDNYLTVSRADAAELGLVNENVANGALNGSYAKVTVGETEVVVPVIIQPGQAKGSVGLALGYGKSKGLKKDMIVGVNAYPLYQNLNAVQNVSITPAEGIHEFACVQLHNTLMGRGDIVKETTLEIFNTKDAKDWNIMPMVSKDHNPYAVTSPEVDLWDEFDRSVGHHFNLSIDLNACTGCGACVIACHAENNVPVVGKSEVRRSRDMHWLRIDRYYSSQDSFEGDNEKKDNIAGLGSSLSEFGEMESPSDNPQVVFQPVMCQHCNHAPCETVCPVAATSHGRQGQNHMAYNRCVGTRYCANNCPYKVRRFNWFLYNNNDEFDYYMNNDLGRMVLNPDVTVRSRGVMEKCSMCIQMTQKTILDAKRDGREVKDGEFQTACSAACSSGAMVFGDINDKDSEVAKLKEDDRMYHLLEHVGTKPNVMYHTKVRNTTEA